MKKVLAFTLSLSLFFVNVIFLKNNKVIINNIDKASAQALNGIVITTDPEFPIPGSNVKVKLETFQFDTEIANISWYYNGKLIEQGIGKKVIELKYPDLGQAADIRVVASIDSSQNYVGGKVLGGATANLLYEPINSYIPAWYSGSAVPAEGGKVKLYAEAYLYSNKKQIPPENLIYDWTINEEPNNSISGVGKSTAIITLDPILGEAYVQVTVKSIDGIYETRTATRVTPSSPALKVYYNNFEVFPRPLDYFFTMNTNEITLSAEPFNAWIDKNNKFLWSVNSIPSTNYSKIFPIRKADNSVGQVDFDLNFENKGVLFQSGHIHSIINFEK